ncbi:MAG: DUF2095 domain-containing protein [Candidatus Bathyarchaeota archaeon]|nr:DUF2095 domain-containing protein [Candidatus Bathyarchaeota archaeon]
MPVEFDKKSFKKMFPHLSDEMEGKEGTVPINSVRTDSDTAEQAVSDKFRHYEPTVIDFIRRCDTETEAEAIITFLEKRGELTEDYAVKLREQLKKEGVRSFGSKKEDNYYFRKGGLC